MRPMQPAWVLNRRPYGDNGFLLELFLGEDGRCSVVVRGARRKRVGGHLASLLQPFSPLLVSLAGRGELKSLRNVEAMFPSYKLRGDILMCGLYLNELLIRTLPRLDPCIELFMCYGKTIEALAEGILELALRRFELAVITELGYQIVWNRDNLGHPIRTEKQDCFEVSRGFRMLENRVKSGCPLIGGHQLLSIDKWLQEGDELSSDNAAYLKKITRQAINNLASGHEVNSRDLLRQLKGVY